MSNRTVNGIVQSSAERAGKMIRSFSTERNGARSNDAPAALIPLVRSCSTARSTFVMSGQKNSATVQSSTIRSRRSHRGISNR
jgi:hypothetical protein